ncbi:MAG: hypothetical protein K6G01_05440 [Eubacterium sp.]|nr:hypothetical protein [Eubacterium sp.]
MEQIPKSFLALFLMVLFLFAGVMVITVAIDAAAAQRYTADATAMISQYNFSDAVIAKCEQTAKDKGYELDVKVMDCNNDGVRDLAELKTTYEYKMKLLGIGTQTHVIRSYAR